MEDFMKIRQIYVFIFTLLMAANMAQASDAIHSSAISTLSASSVAKPFAFVSIFTMGFLGTAYWIKQLFKSTSTVQEKPAIQDAEQLKDTVESEVSEKVDSNMQPVTS